MQLFYAPDLTGSKYSLSVEESKHCLKVLRLKLGDRISLTDGNGNLHDAVIEGQEKGRVLLDVVKTIPEYGKKDYNIHMAIAPTKSNDRFEWFVEKATEIGVDEITPFISEHSERRKIREDRIEKVIIAAIKQSGKAYKPKLNPLIRYPDFFQRAFQQPGLYVAHCHDKEKHTLAGDYIPGNDAVIMIGPEGDFSEKEIEMALKNRFKPVTFGDARLRTETAGIVACHTIFLLNQNK
ncbi:MAG: 16S rRNA (uracil(1498)-N(3))-methyltransferase [Bacteroidales bacterium]|jgi:16S rRNA (uracil1498-N3)-methyltransferase